MDTVQINNREENFVAAVIRIITQDKGKAAALKKGDNPSFEYLSWGVLAPFIDLEKEYLRVPFATIAAAVAKAKITSDGSLSIGSAIANCYSQKGETSQGEAKLRRLLACENSDEICLVLRSLLAFITSKGIQLHYARLLKEITEFYFRPEKIKTRWAKAFYQTKEEENDDS